MRFFKRLASIFHFYFELQECFNFTSQPCEVNMLTKRGEGGTVTPVNYGISLVNTFTSDDGIEKLLALFFNFFGRSNTAGLHNYFTLTIF